MHSVKFSIANEDNFCDFQFHFFFFFFFFFFAHCTHSEKRSTLTSTHNLCFEQEYENYQCFLSENFHFLEVKFSIYLNRRVLVMNNIYSFTQKETSAF